MRRLGILSVLALLATWVTVVAVDAGASVLTPTASAQGDPATPQMNYSHVEVPFFEEWIGSGHADLNSEAFIHWNEDDPPLVPARCGACHSSAGHADYLGLDGTEFGVVDEATEPGVIQCSTCHNEVTLARTTVEMPSGVVLTDLGREASCMTCHQGRANGATVSQAVEEAGVGMDEIMSEQGFINIHYYAAAATLYGSEAAGGFEYENAYYEPRFEHVEGYDSCQSCHNPHTLELEVESCATCPIGADTIEDVREIRMPGSFVDYDGDGDIYTGIKTEIENLHALLYDAMQAYSQEFVGTQVLYDSHAYPYFFGDADGDGEADADEINYGNRFQSWTPRLLQAAYNYQVVAKDPGGYAHNAKYLIQLLHDSIMDLAEATGDSTMALGRPGDEPAVQAQASSYDHSALVSSIPVLDTSMVEAIRRDDAGHFDATTEAWRHWDEDGAVSASCATCHSADGLPFSIEHGTQIEQDISQGMACSTCHVDNVDFEVLSLEEVEFPSGAVLTFGNSGDNLCATCHQGRASTESVNARIGDAGDDEVAAGLGFVNVHYFAAAATRFGGEASGGYEYEGNEYVGFWEHDLDVSTCTQCHDPHNQQVDIVASCSDCHDGAATIADVRDFREFPGDWDGDGETTEGTYYEIATMQTMLYDAMLSYAANTIGTPIVYDSSAYPYFFIDTDADGEPDADEANYGNQYPSWTPRLMRAAYNYQYSKKDTGSYVHNSQYIIQLLHDSIADLGVDVSAMDRPDDPF